MKPGVTELIVVLLIVVVIFGPTQIPKLTKMIGKSIKNLRAGMAEEDEDEAESKPKAKKKSAEEKVSAEEKDSAEEE